VMNKRSMVGCRWVRRRRRPRSFANFERFRVYFVRAIPVCG
jgi:hypothetical protein